MDLFHLMVALKAFERFVGMCHASPAVRCSVSYQADDVLIRGSCLAEAVGPVSEVEPVLRGAAEGFAKRVVVEAMWRELPSVTHDPEKITNRIHFGVPGYVLSLHR
jgi:hypothetical protein